MIRNLELFLRRARSGISTRLGSRSRAHAGHSQRNHSIAQPSALSSRKRDPGVRQKHSQRAHQSNEITIRNRMRWADGERRRTKPGKRDRYHRAPRFPHQVPRMGGKVYRFHAPVCKPKKCPDSQSSKPGAGAAFRRFQPPLEVPLFPCQMDPGIGLSVISLLINDQSVASGANPHPINFFTLRLNLHRKAGKPRSKPPDDVLHIRRGDLARMLAGDQQEMTESLRRENFGLCLDLLDMKSPAFDRVRPGEAAIRTSLHAFIRKVERRKELDRASEAA